MRGAQREEQAEVQIRAWGRCYIVEGHRSLRRVTSARATASPQKASLSQGKLAYFPEKEDEAGH